MIISASYRTDIPALYAAWFENRFEDGFCLVRNPYGGQASRVELKSGVDGFVFWTRNAGPFLPALATVHGEKFPFVLQYTTTGYPRALETSVPDRERTSCLMGRIADLYGPHVLVWRYDPIVLTSLTPYEWHLENFDDMAERLRGMTDEVTVSFVQPYAKTVRNMRLRARQEGFSWHLPEHEEKMALIGELSGIAALHGMKLTLCTQPGLTAAALPAACIDADRLARIAGCPLPTIPRKGNRPGCRCSQSRDIGAYDSCTQGCAYCYGVSDATKARQTQKDHDSGHLLIHHTRKEH